MVARRGALAALIVLALAAAGCGSGRATHARRANSASTTTQVVGGESPPTSGSASEAAPAPGRRGPAVGSPATTAPGQTKTPQQTEQRVQPPAPGVYFYDTHGAYTYAARDHPLPNRTTLTIDPAVGVSQHAARNLRDVDGNGPVVETTLRYEPDGLYLDLLRETTRVEGLDDAREYRPSPPVLLAPRNAGVGYKASYDAADGGTAVHVDSTVERRDTVVIAGTPVQCYVVHAVTTFHGTVEGGGEGTSCVSVEYRLLLTEEVTTRFTAAGTDVRGAYRAILTSLTPAPPPA